MNVLVIGPGTIGASLALTCAIYGHSTILLGRSETSVRRGMDLVARSAAELQDAGLMPDAGADWQDRLATQTQIAGVSPCCDIAIEAIYEDVDQKQDLLQQLEDHLENATLASSTSGLPANSLNSKCARPDRFVVAHFANPPHLMPVVELVPASDTSEDTMRIASNFVSTLGKSPVTLKRDIPGHLFNRIQFAMLREAMALVEDGVASPDQIDTVIKRGLALRLAEEGPLEKMDLATLQLVHDVAKYLFPSLNASKSPDFLARMLENGHLGAASGQGFHSWSDEAAGQVVARRNAEVIRQLKRLKKED